MKKGRKKDHFHPRHLFSRQSDCSRGRDSDRAGFTRLVKALSTVFKPSDLTLAASISGYPSVLEKGYELEAIGQDLDLVNLMTYDYHGFWDGETGHHAPLFAVAEGRSEALGFTVVRQNLMFCYSLGRRLTKLSFPSRTRW